MAVVFVCLLSGRDPSAQVTNSTVRKIDATNYAIANIRIDLAQHEVSVPGTINDVATLEFVANTRNGMKAYESAVSADTDAVTFNTALLLLGLDVRHARVPKMHFDPAAPEGDPVEVYVEGTIGGVRKRLRIEQLLLDRRTNQPMPSGPWVYTGSTWLRDETHERYMADIDGVLIGFVHSPAPIIENPGKGAVKAYGWVVLNRGTGLEPGAAVTLIVKAVAPAVKGTPH